MAMVRITVELKDIVEMSNELRRLRERVDVLLESNNYEVDRRRKAEATIITAGRKPKADLAAVRQNGRGHSVDQTSD